MEYHCKNNSFHYESYCAKEDIEDLLFDKDGSRNVDTAIATFLVLIAVIGIPLCSLALRYFITKEHRNNNSLYFDRLYQLTSALDILTCIFVIPIVGIGFSERRSFAHSLDCARYFKIPWIIVWGSIPPCSSFLVACISLSRLLMIVKPNTNLKPKVALILPIVYALVTLVINVSICLPGYFKVRCHLNTMQCLIRPDFCGHSNPEEDLSFVLILWMALDILQLGLPVILVLMSCGASVGCLAKQKPISSNATERTKEVSLTVIIFTVLFIVCNFPLLFLNYTSILFVTYHHGNGTAAEVKGNMLKAYNGNRALYNYLEIISRVFLISLNSVLNPIVFFWRMRPFHIYIRGLLGMSLPSASNTNVNATSNSSTNLSTTI